MTVCALFTIAGIISLQNCRGVVDTDEEQGEQAFFGVVAIICWLVAALAGAGVIGG